MNILQKKISAKVLSKLLEFGQENVPITFLYKKEVPSNGIVITSENLSEYFQEFHRYRIAKEEAEYIISHNSVIEIRHIHQREKSSKSFFGIEVHNCEVRNHKFHLFFSNGDRQVKEIFFSNCKLNNIQAKYLPKISQGHYLLSLEKSIIKGITSIEEADIGFQAKNTDFNRFFIRNSSIYSSHFEYCELKKFYSNTCGIHTGNDDFHNVIFPKQPDSNMPTVTIERCYGEKLLLQNLILAEGSTLALKRNRFQQSTLRNTVFFNESNILIDEYYLNNFNIEVSTPSSITINSNCLWAFSTPLSEPWFKVRTYRKNGFNYPSKVSLKEDFAHSEKYKYIELRKIAKENGDKHLEDDFYFCQMYWELEERKNNFINLLYKHLCGYGFSVCRPVLSILLIFGLFTLIYCAIYKLAPETDLKTIPEFSSFLLLSLSGTIPVLNIFDKFPDEVSIFSSNAIFWVLTLYYFQKALQLFFLIEVGSAIRNRVKK